MISVLTLVKNREGHLRNLVEGLRRSALAPAELVIVDMSDHPVERPESDFPTSIIRHEVAGLPFAQARNLAAAQASSEALLFLDVDCIPASQLLGAMSAALNDQDALICAEIRYLAAAALVGDSWTERTLLAAGRPHPVRDFPTEGLRREANAGLFWSLAFGIARATFSKIGGFDEDFTGYGAEDTDFGFRARDAGIELFFLGGPGAFHQHHGVVDPPLQHFDDIVRNARIFYRKWQIWPMRAWLDTFAEMGLILKTRSDLILLRIPTQEEILAAERGQEARF